MVGRKESVIDEEYFEATYENNLVGNKNRSGILDMNHVLLWNVVPMVILFLSAHQKIK